MQPKGKMEKNTVTCPAARCHSWKQNVDSASYQTDRHTKPYAHTHTHRPRRTRIPFQFTQQTCTQHINQLALAKTFEIDFKFFGPLFLYATKGQFFVLCLQGHVWHLHTHLYTYTRTRYTKHARRPEACKLAALFMSFGLSRPGLYCLLFDSIVVLLQYIPQTPVPLSFGLGH